MFVVFVFGGTPCIPEIEGIEATVVGVGRAIEDRFVYMMELLYEMFGWKEGVILGTEVPALAVLNVLNTELVALMNRVEVVTSVEVRNSVEVEADSSDAQGVRGPAPPCSHIDCDTLAL